MAKQSLLEDFRNRVYNTVNVAEERTEKPRVHSRVELMNSFMLCTCDSFLTRKKFRDVWGGKAMEALVYAIIDAAWARMWPEDTEWSAAGMPPITTNRLLSDSVDGTELASLLETAYREEDYTAFCEATGLDAYCEVRLPYRAALDFSRGRPKAVEHLMAYLHVAPMDEERQENFRDRLWSSFLCLCTNSCVDREFIRRNSHQPSTKGFASKQDMYYPGRRKMGLVFDTGSTSDIIDDIWACVHLAVSGDPLASTAFMEQHLASLCDHLPTLSLQDGLTMLDDKAHPKYEKNSAVWNGGQPGALCQLDLSKQKLTAIAGTEDDPDRSGELICLSPNALIAKLIRQPVLLDRIQWPRHMEDMFVMSGADKSEAREYCIIAATAAACLPGSPPWRSGIEGTREEQQDGPDEVKLLREQLDEARGKAERLEQRLAASEAREKKADRELRKAKYELEQAKRAQRHPEEQELKSLASKNKELAEDVEMLELALKQAQEQKPAKADVVFPYRTDKQVLLFGGHTSFLQEIRNLLPDIQLIRKQGGSINTAPIRNADLVCFQCNNCSHPNYHTVFNATKALGKKVLFLGYSSAKQCALAIIDKLENPD